MKLHVAKAPVTWVLVADAKTAQIYLPTLSEHRIPLVGNGKRRHTEIRREWGLTPILAKPLTAESAQHYEIGRNRLGRVFESFSSLRHMASPHIDVHKEIRQHFATRIADFLANAKMGKAFDRLVLVAPPEMLGEIDAKLDDNIRRKLKYKVAKMFAGFNAAELAERLKDYLR